MLRKDGKPTDENDEWYDPEQGAEEDQTGAPSLALVRQMASAQSQGSEAQQHVAHHDPPVGHWCAADQGQRLSRSPGPQDGAEVNDRRQQINGQHFGADARDPPEGIGNRVAPPFPDGSGINQEEMEKSRRQKKQCHGAGREHEGVDPGVRSRTQPAHEEEHEKAAHREENPRGRQSRLPQNNEGADPEEKKTEQRGVKIGRVTNPTPAELDLHLEDPPARANQIRHRIADVVPVQEFLGVGLRIEEEGPVDTDDHIRGPDSRAIGTRTRHHSAHDPRTRDIGLQNHAVVGVRQEHIRNRKGGYQECQDPGRQRHRQTPLRPLHQHIIRVCDASCSRRDRKIEVKDREKSTF